MRGQAWKVSRQSRGTTVLSCLSGVGVTEEGQREKAGACHGALLEGQKLYSWVFCCF